MVEIAEATIREKGTDAIYYPERKMSNFQKGSTNIIAETRKGSYPLAT